MRIPAVFARPRFFASIAAPIAAVLFGGAVIVGGAPVQAQPLQFVATLEQSAWEARSAEGRCLLRHRIAGYGAAEFSRGPGAALRLRVDAPKPPMDAVQAALRSVPPPWNHTVSAADLGIHLMERPDALVIEGADAQVLLDALERGLNIEIGFGPAGASEQAVVTLSTVRLRESLPVFAACAAALPAPRAETPPASAKTPTTVRPAAAPRSRTPIRSAPVPRRPAAAAPQVIEDPYIRTDVITVGATPTPASAESVPPQGADVTVPTAEPDAPARETASGVGLVDEVALRYAPDQSELSEGARVQLGSLAREYLAQGRRDVVLIAGSAAHGALTRRRALEIKGYLVRMGVPATHVTIHVPGEKLPQRNGHSVVPPEDATRMMVWRVR